MKGRVRRERVPSAEQVEEKRTTQFVETLRDTLEKGEYQRYDEIVDYLLEQGHSPTDIASALIDTLARETTRELEPIIEPRPHAGPLSRPEAAPRHAAGRRHATHEPSARDREHAVASPRSHEVGMTRLVMNAGKLGGVGPGDVVGVIAGLAGLSRESIGAIRVMPQQTFVDVVDDSVDLVLKKLKGIKFKGRKLAIGRAG